MSLDKLTQKALIVDSGLNEKEAEEIIISEDKFQGRMKSILELIINSFYLRSSLSIHGYEHEDFFGMKINSTLTGEPIYCIDLDSATDGIRTISEGMIDNLYDKYKNEDLKSFLVQAVVKNKGKTNNYLFSHNREMIVDIARYFDAELVPAFELVNVLYSLMIPDEVKKFEESLSYKFIHKDFNKILRDSILESFGKFNLYQSMGLKDEREEIDFDVLSELNFDGVIYHYMDFNTASAVRMVDKKMSSKILIDERINKNLRKLKKAIVEEKVYPITVNTALLIKGIGTIEEEKKVYSKIGDMYGVVFQKQNSSSIATKRVIKYTSLVYRNEEYCELMPVEHLYNYICK